MGIVYDDEGMSRAEQKAAREAHIRERLEELAVDLNREDIPPHVEAPKHGPICRTFWGQAWCRHLHTYAAWEHRITRGRSLLRKGAVYALAVEEGRVTGYVATDDLYKVSIEVGIMDDETRAHILDCGRRDPYSLMDLWEGKMSDAVVGAMTGEEGGLFPRREELRSVCSCDDWADLCEHGAAVLYALGIYFESSPESLFAWRGVNLSDWMDELWHTSNPTTTGGTALGTESEPFLSEDDLSAVFGIEFFPNMGKNDENTGISS